MTQWVAKRVPSLSTSATISGPMVPKDIITIGFALNESSSMGLPPLTLQSLVKTPIGRPDIRANPVTMLLPQYGPISKNVNAASPLSEISTMALITFRISYGLDLLLGMISSSSSSRRSAGSLQGRTGGNENTEEGRYERKVRICWKASDSEEATLSTVPLVAWISHPPSSDFERSSKVACLTTGGPAAKS